MRYRLITSRLRVQRGPGHPDLVVERPRLEGPIDRKVRRPKYADGPDNPTLVEFDGDCQVDIEWLLRVGAIEEYSEVNDSGQTAS